MNTALILRAEIAFFHSGIRRKIMRSVLKEPAVKYITSNGKPSEVILSLKDYERLLHALEDLRDIRSADRRRTEPSIEYVTYRKKRLSRIKSSR